MESQPTEAKAASRPVPWSAIAALSIFAIGFALYARTMGFEFVDWDDVPLIVNNPYIQGFSIENLVAIWTQPVLNSFFPLQATSYLFDHALWGLDPAGYHLHSVLLNALNGVLAFWVLSMLTRRPILAFVAALLFTVHHSHVSSVAWVSTRKELLFGTFLLLSLGTYLRARREGGFDAKFYAASLLCFVLGAAAKTTIATFPLFFLLVDWFEDRRLAPEQRRSFGFHLATKLPYLALVFPLAWMSYEAQLVSDTARESDLLGYLLVKGQAGWRYLWVLFGLLPGQPIYDPPPISRLPFWAAATLLPLVLPLLLFWFALRRSLPNLALGLAWIIVGMVPPLVFPLTTYMADRYLYMPSLGFCWLLAAGIVSFSRVESRRSFLRVGSAAALTALPLLWFAANAWSYTHVWRNSETLWTYAVKRSSDGRAATALSAALVRSGNLEKAEEVLRKARNLGANGYLHLAVVYLEQDRLDEAHAASSLAMRIAGRQPPAPADGSKLLFIHGVILAKLGRGADAIESWKAAVVVDPTNADARRVLDGIAAAESGDEAQPAPDSESEALGEPSGEQ